MVKDAKKQVFVSEVTDLEKIRRVPFLVTGGVLNHIFCVLTFFGSIFVLFMNEIGMDKFQIGLVLSFLPFMGLTAFIVSPLTAKFGVKRAFLLFWLLRNGSGVMLVFTPLIYSRYGETISFYWMAGVVFLFALCRAIGEVANLSWMQEILPNYIRGKVNAVIYVSCMIAGIIVIAGGSYLVGHYQSQWRFSCVFALATVMGLVSVWFYSFLPGGKPIRTAESLSIKSILDPFRDRNFQLFLMGMGLVTIGSAPMFSFIPLFMKEHVGLDSGTTIRLDLFASAGALVSCYLWGWASDRYGSKPVLLSGIIIMFLLPFFWFLMPKHSSWSQVTAYSISFILGIGNIAWLSGYSRYLFVSAVPSEKKMTYMAVFYAWMGLVGGVGPLVVGKLLDITSGIKLNIFIFSLDAFTPLFGISLLFLASGIMIFQRIRSDGEMPVRKFVSMFFQGNPIIALESLVRYNYARDDISRVALTQRLGEAQNPLSANELIESLSDPSFSVRFESIISISRLPAEPKLVDALVLVLVGSEPDLSIAAAWALGKLGDKSAILPLREMMLSEFQLIQAHCARALAKLGDSDSAGYFLEQLQKEPNEKIKLAYASAIGMVRYEDGADEILKLLYELHDSIQRYEMALAISRILGDEGHFIRLWRMTRHNSETNLAQAIMTLIDDIQEHQLLEESAIKGLRIAGTGFSKGDSVSAITEFSNFLEKTSTVLEDEFLRKIFIECCERINQFGMSRDEYILLALQAIHKAVISKSFKKSNIEENTL